MYSKIKSNPLLTVVIVGLFIGMASALFLYVNAGGFISTNSLASPIKSCQVNNDNEATRIDCWMGLIESTFSTSGTAEAFSVFKEIYTDYSDFSNTGCHRHAHRVGDLAYYYDYLSHGDYKKIDFPESANACGYGFYHGLFEHIVQGKPETLFIEEMCESLETLILEEAPAIRQTCYHGAGHGLVLAQADIYTDAKDWTIDNFTHEPLIKCSALKTASDYEKEECFMGIYNVLVDWMADEEYNLTYNVETPFWFCDELLDFTWQRACYNEVAQKLDMVSGRNLESLKKIADNIKRTDLREYIIGVALPGFVQHDPTGNKEKFYLECISVFSDYSSVCVKSIAAGLVEHGPPGEEYMFADGFCASAVVVDEHIDVCYEQLTFKLQRFNSPEKLKNLCESERLSKRLCTEIQNRDG